MATKSFKPGELQDYSRESDSISPTIYVQRTARILQKLPVRQIEEVIEQCFRAYLSQRVIYIFGNGGSAALSSHAACDLGKGTAIKGSRALRVISLADNVPLITAWANDVAYENIFAAQLEPLLQPGDIAFAISGSGNSPNVLKALSVARNAGAINIGLTGGEGGTMRGLCDFCITVPSENMQHIEDAHVCVIHAIFLALRQLLNTNGSRPGVTATGRNTLVEA